MKKFISLVMAFVLCMAFMILTFAEDKPEEISADNLNNVSGNCIISEKGEYEVDSISVEEGSTLIIGKDVKIKMVGGTFDNRGKIEVDGQLDLSQCSTVNNLGNITVSYNGIYITKDGLARFGYNENLDDSFFDDYSFPIRDSFGSTISEGNIWIIAGIAIIAIGAMAIVIKKKKKSQVPATVEGPAETETKE